MSTEAVWVNGKRRVTGRWRYNWASDLFHIELDQRDRVTGSTRCFTAGGDVPEWGNWKRVRAGRSLEHVK